MVKARVILAAPHRALFLIGVIQFAALIAWWALALLNLSGLGPRLPQAFPATLLHAPMLLLLALPPLFFGFLLTVFPRWLGFPDSSGRVYGPVAAAFAAAALLVWAGLLTGSIAAIAAAFLLAGAGFIWALGVMARLLLAERRLGKGPSWHGWSALAATLVGLGCIAMVLRGLRTGDGGLVQQADRLALHLFALPVFFTVCHRMVPFFAANVVKGYRAWRPFWLLGVFWTASLAAASGAAAQIPALAAAGSCVRAGLCLLMLWRWWPRGAAPGLLWVLIIGFAWASPGYAWEAAAALGDNYASRGAIHALTIGFAGSLIIAMVTRVTQGHSGRPLEMPRWAWVAFLGVQASALSRLASAWRGDIQLPLLTASALILLAALAPWALRNAGIYLVPRRDGKPG